MSRIIELLKYHSAMASDKNLLVTLLRSQLLSLPEPVNGVIGHTIIVTGASSGLGLEAARHFVSLGAAKVILGCRSWEKGEAAKRDIESSTLRKGVAEVWFVDLTSFDSVKSFCCRAASLERLDSLILNAGVATGEFVAVDGGYESQIAVNVISTFLLAFMLLPRLRDTAERFHRASHVVVVSSDGHFFARFPERSRPVIFDAYKDKAQMSDDRYNTSKLLGVLVARELAKVLDSTGDNLIIVNIVTPGVCKSQIFRNLPSLGKFGISIFLALMGRTSEVGSRTLVSAAAAGKATHGKYLSSCQISEPSAFVRSEEGAAVQSKVYIELIDILERIQPGIYDFTRD